MSHSVYQTNGKPLSQQAIYQQKLKYGIYNKPDKPSLGVNSNASDTAALLAAMSDLTVKPVYERNIAEAAQQAANASQTIAKPKYTTKADVFNRSHPESNTAALSVYSSPKPEYYYHDIRSEQAHVSTKVNLAGLHTNATSNASLSMSTRTDPERDYRSGLKTSGSKPDFHIGKITAMATSNSTKTMDSRLNPELDYRSGLITTSEFLTDDEERLAANGAAASLYKNRSGSFSTTRSKSFVASDIVNVTLMNKANAQASDRLKTINSEVVRDYKNQAKLYAGALLIAQQNSELRQQSYGKVDLGGGLTMSPQELHALASKIVRPVLADMDNKIQAQREIDYQVALEREEQKQKHKEYKLRAAEAKLKLKEDKIKAKEERKLNHENDKKEAESKVSEFQKLKDQEVVDEELKTKQQEEEHKAIQDELLSKKQFEQERIESEEAELIAAREAELKELQDNKTSEIKPVLDELKVESAKLKELQDAKAELVTFHDSEKTKNDELTAKHEQLTSSIKTTEDKISQLHNHLEQLGTKEVEIENNHNNLSKETEIKLNDLEAQSSDYDNKIKELEAEKKTQLDLKASKKKEIDSQLQDKLRDERKINNALPDHLKKEINESSILDTSDVISLPPVKESNFAPVKVEEPKAAPKVEKPSQKVTTSAPASGKPAVSPKRNVAATKPASPATTKSPVKNSTATASPASPVSPEKKKGFRNRFSKIFSSDGGVNNTTGPTLSNGARAPQSVASAEKLVLPKSIKATSAKEELDENEDFDDFSINEGQNKGGLFKEEI